MKKVAAKRHKKHKKDVWLRDLVAKNKIADIEGIELDKRGVYWYN